ncbi:MFS general substrate transporter [Trichodelitschia bisporula]|uniref:MFS general substrate transporter n=1 Tax=Trichodelitschia bisporula TaxID=703511 RepID=A0A6G1HQW1_9PEZI|nr:MFS general substrate transporter [Trichodelitschia bisporula]
MASPATIGQPIPTPIASREDTSTSKLAITPPAFSFALNCLFGFAGAFTVANLYYNHPILNILAHDFDVKYEKAAQIPTVMQAGYAAGLLFLCPLGDLFKRRPFVLLLVFATATMCFISFLTAFTTVTPQLMLPLVGDLAPINRRATALSIVVSGLTLGILIARVIAGAMAEYTSWRNIYWMSAGLQYLIFALLWCFMPDYPSTNPGGLNYLKMLWSMPVMFVQNPILPHACIISFFVSATFTAFWTTLTFLLAGPPYNLLPLPIGLFGLIGIGGMLFGPIYARLVTDRFVPWLSVLVGLTMVLSAVCVGTYTGSFSIAGPIIQAVLHDAGMLTTQVANRSQIYALAAKARNRVNTVFMLATFCGQLTGTAAGNHVYARGGWIRSGSMSVGFASSAILILCLRGPWEKGWLGWHGGWGMGKKDARSADGHTVERAQYERSVGDVEACEARAETLSEGEKKDGDFGNAVRRSEDAGRVDVGSEKSVTVAVVDDEKGVEKS